MTFSGRRREISKGAVRIPPTSVSEEEQQAADERGRRIMGQRHTSL